MRALKTFLLGAVALGILAYALAAALAVAAQAAGRALEIAVGPLAVVTVTHGGTATVTTFGPGLGVVALAGGLANVAIARLARQRFDPPSDRVD